jgi:hypothetical protein
LTGKAQKLAVRREYPESGMDFAILEALARFQYLTRELMRRLGVGKNESHLGLRLNALKAGKLVACSKTPVEQDFGRLPAFWWLTAKGAAVLAEQRQEAVSFPKNGNVSPKDNKHRQGQVRCAMALDAIASHHGGQVAPLRFDFEYRERREGAAYAESVTTLHVEEGALKPDILAGVTLPDGILRPVAVEYETGGENHRHENLTNKLPKYAAGLEAGLIGRALNVQEPPRVLVVCKSEKLLHSILAGWPSRSADDWPEFYLQTIEAIEADPFGNWYRIGEPPCPLFPRH